MAEEPVLEHVHRDTTGTGTTREACSCLGNTLLKAVDRHRIKAVGGTRMSIEILLKWHTGGGMLLSEHIDDGAAGLGVQIEWAIGFVNIPARYRAYGSVGRLIGVEGLATPPCIISIGHKRLEVVPVFCRIILVASGCRILHHWWHRQHPRRGMWVEGSPRGGTGSWGHPEVAVIDLRECLLCCFVPASCRFRTLQLRWLPWCDSWFQLCLCESSHSCRLTGV
jgi:hypothetical protein